jgi:predicted DCC family thiol-disulfide oxidoreductase YuxK
MMSGSGISKAEGQRACLTVYYDGSCALCRREIALVSSLAVADLSLLDVSTLGEARAAPDLTANKAMRRFHVRRPDGTLVSGANAFLEMWSLVPRLAFLKRLQRSPRTIWLLDQLYNVLLLVRPWVSRAAARYDRSVEKRKACEKSSGGRAS